MHSAEEWVELAAVELREDMAHREHGVDSGRRLRRGVRRVHRTSLHGPAVPPRLRAPRAG